MCWMKLRVPFCCCLLWSKRFTWPNTAKLICKSALVSKRPLNDCFWNLFTFSPFLSQSLHYHFPLNFFFFSNRLPRQQFVGKQDSGNWNMYCRSICNSIAIWIITKRKWCPLANSSFDLDMISVQRWLFISCASL